MNKNRTYLILILILILSFAIRIWHLSSNPAGFFCDEAAFGIDAFSIINTGKGMHGQFLPVFFRGLGDAASGPLFTYSIIPFISIFGLTEQAIRLPVVITGSIEIILFYFLLLEFIPSPFALLGALFLSISPWHLHISRISIGDMFLWSFITLIAYLFFIKASRTNRTKYFILSAFFFGLVMYVYIASRLITPLLFGAVIILTLFKKNIKNAILMLISFLIICIPLARYHITDPYSSLRIMATLGIDANKPAVTQVVTEVTKKQFLSKYLLHYSDLFLFKKGDADFPGQTVTRHSITGLGLLFPYQKHLIIIGIIWLLVKLLKSKRTELLVIVFLFFLFPLADTLTYGPSPYATRSYLGVLPFHILIAFGVYAIFQFLQIIKLWNNKIVKILSGAILILLVLFSTHTLLVKLENNPLTTSGYWGWQYGPRDIMKYFLSVKDNYDELYMSPDYNAPEIFLKFYDPYNECTNKCQIGIFTSYQQSKRQLFALSPNSLDQSKFKANFLVKKIIYYPNGRVAFLIGEVR